MELNSLPRSRHTYEQLNDGVGPHSEGSEPGANLGPSDSPDQHYGSPHAQHRAELFDPLDQALTLFCKQSVRWLGTAILIAFIIAILKIYEKKGNFSPAQRDIFNTINIALNIGLSLNFFVSQPSASDQNMTKHLGHIRVRSRIQRKYYDGSSGHSKGLPPEKRI